MTQEFGDAQSLTDEPRANVGDSNVTAVVSVDTRGRVREWDMHAERMFEWRRAEATGREIAQLIVPRESRRQYDESVGRYLAARAAHTLGCRVEMEVKAKSNLRIPVEISLYPTTEDQNEKLFMAFIVDVTDRKESEARQRKRWEEAEQANEMLRDYWNLMVHELRRPLTVIAGYASLLADVTWSDAPPPAREALDELLRQTGAANKLVEQLLMIARAETGGLTGEPVILNVADEITGVIARTAARAALLHGTVTANVPFGETFASADHAWTALILDNLVNNALIHSGAEPRVEVGLRPGRPVSIYVADRGRGIPPSIRDEIFDKFVHSPEKGATGTGLGLYLSRRLARLQGGDLALEPDRGAGACFRLDLPSVLINPRVSVASPRR